MIEIKTVFADSIDDMLKKTYEIDEDMHKANIENTEFELMKSSTNIHKISDSKVLYCNVLVYKVGDDDAEL